MIILLMNNNVNLWEILSAIGTLGAVLIAVFFQFFEDRKRKKGIQRMIKAIRIELEGNVKILKREKLRKDSTHCVYSKEFFKKIKLDTWSGYKYQIAINDIEEYNKYNQVNSNLEFILKIENVYLSGFNPITDADIYNAIKNVINFEENKAE